MSKFGSLMFVLNTHMPYVKNKCNTQSMEYDWFLQCMLDCYVPLIGMVEELADEGLNFSITMSFSAPILEMMRDAELPLLFDNFLCSRLGNLHSLMTHSDSNLQSISEYQQNRLNKCKDLYFNKWNCNIINVLKKLSNCGAVSLITSAISHAYLPLWEPRPLSVQWQIENGINYFESVFQKRPDGFWLPECGYYKGLEYILKKENIRYFFVAHDGLMKGSPIPRYGINLPVICPNGVSVFSKDWFVHNKVWDEYIGYPGEKQYINFYSDIVDFISSDHSNNHASKKTNISYLNRAGTIYNNNIVYSIIRTHANDFICECTKRFQTLTEHLPEKPIIIGLFDTEHFGHFWHEGVRWLKEVIIGLNQNKNIFNLSTPEEYLKGNPKLQIIQPSPSSWGYQGYNETWLVGDNHYIYPVVLSLIEEIEKLFEDETIPHYIRNIILRELWEAQTSDWAFLIQKNNFAEYAHKRFTEHCENIITLLDNCKHDHATNYLKNNIAKYGDFLRDYLKLH